SSGLASPRFSRHSRSKAASSLPMITRASEPPMKLRRLKLLGEIRALSNGRVMTPPILMLAHFLRSIAEYAQRVGRQVPEQVVEVAAIERTTGDALRRVGDDRGQIDVQRREHLFQIVGAAVEILRIDVGTDRVRYIPGEGRDEFDVRQPHGICGLRRPSTRHQLADCCSNRLSLSHGHLHWLGLGPVASSQLAIGLHCTYTFDVLVSIQKVQKWLAATGPVGAHRNALKIARFRCAYLSSFCGR